MTLDEFEAMPTIMSYFPLTFASGNQKWTAFEVACNECNRNVPHDCTRGYVERQVTGTFRAVQSTSYEVIAHALCPMCNKLTTATYVLHEDMTFEGIHAKSGKRRRGKLERSPEEFTLRERVLGWLRSLVA